jgi:hypothetical protein
MVVLGGYWQNKNIIFCCVSAPILEWINFFTFIFIKIRGLEQSGVITPERSKRRNQSGTDYALGETINEFL